MNRVVPRVISLFSGAGGFDIGFASAGYQIVFSSDIEETFCKTLRLNSNKFFRLEHYVLCANIVDLNADDIPCSDPDLVIGGPPCQSFSAAGRRAGGVNGIYDFRGSLFWHYIRLIAELKPKAFVFENVRGLLQARKGEDWKIIKHHFENLGYDMAYRVLDAADYGVPQHRERLIVVGVLDGHFLFPRPSHGLDSLPIKTHISVGEALADITNLDEKVSPYGGKYGDLLAEVPPGMNYLYFTEEMGHPHPKFAWRSRFSDFLYKVDPAFPCKTIVASQGRYSGPFHWKGRKFTIQEFKRLQSIPDEYQLYGSHNLQIKQIGNSVAPKFAEAIARAILMQVFGVQQDIELIADDFPLSFDLRKAKKAKNTRKLNVLKNDIRQLTIFNIDSNLQGLIQDNNQTKVQPKTNLYSTINYSSPKHSLNTKNSSIYSSFNLQANYLNGFWDCDLEEIYDKNLGGVEVKILIKFPRDIRGLVEVNIKFLLKNGFSLFSVWDVAHKCVAESTSFDTLHPLYGHFTEPYPKFTIQIETSSKEDPVLALAIKATNYSFCNTTHPLIDIAELFGRNPKEVAVELRRFRWDIRTYETNRTIPKDKFRLCYPFCISLNNPSYVQWIEEGEHKTADISSIPHTL